VGTWIAIRVSDCGPGLSSEDLERIFEPFQSTGSSAGSGLGLAIARGFVEASGGRLRVRSEPGQGSTFSIQLPATPSARAAGAVPASS
jgi:signal transduction histidine kinase